MAPLSSALMSVADDDDDLAQSALYKIVHILLPFGQSDLKVKMELAQRPVILRKPFARIHPMTYRDTHARLQQALCACCASCH